MKKVHEQEWVVGGPLDNTGRIPVTEPDGRVVCLVRREDAAALAPAIAALPDCLRALMALGKVRAPGVWHMDVCAERRSGPCLGRCQDARDALTKAGALP